MNKETEQVKEALEGALSLQTRVFTVNKERVANAIDLLSTHTLVPNELLKKMAVDAYFNEYGGEMPEHDGYSIEEVNQLKAIVEGE